ncbi:glycosyltransferase [Bacillus massiliglaciei]|uniref:glycosyltransferase n=1 Tax=Bacillus massiliglaciei TaxID=1816693 RepID=UPI000DA5F82A|nr:glycosyltransferase [Bacillus massiliglaciei]
MSKRRIVVEINFNNYGLDPQRLTKEWIERRLALFHNFTLKSLKKQTNQEFLTVVKLAGGCSDIVDQALKKYEPLPENIKFGTSIESQRRIEAYIEGYDELYVARQDSDDLYHKSFVQQLHDYKHQLTTQVLINQDGYMWDTEENRMVPIHFTSPQYYTFIYSVEDYLEGKRYVLPGGHGYAIKLPHEILKPRNYVNIVHPSITSKKKVPRGTGFTPEVQKKILDSFM